MDLLAIPQQRPAICLGEVGSVLTGVKSCVESILQLNNPQGFEQHLHFYYLPLHA